jgi:hypothetical protein
MIQNFSISSPKYLHPIRVTLAKGQLDNVHLVLLRSMGVLELLSLVSSPSDVHDHDQPLVSLGNHHRPRV